MLGTAAIITHRKIIEASLRQHRISQIDTERSTYIHEMTSALAHELIQPLTAINIYATTSIEQLRNKKDSLDSIISTMNYIKENAMRANSIIIRINDMANKMPIKCQKTSINPVIENTVQLFQHMCEDDSIQYELMLEENLPLLSIDQILIGQVLHNLMRNSIDALALQNAVPPMLTLASKREGADAISVVIKDNGPGIQADLVDNVFDPYFTTKRSGMGLGLSICRKIIEAHGGHLFIKSTSKIGTCFQFTLPFVNTP